VTWFRAVFDLGAVLLWARVLGGVLVRPSSRWRTGWLGKAVSIVAVAVGQSTWWGFFIPWVLPPVWWLVMVRGRDPFELPMADGRRMP
jgi:hypothetical protein